MTGGHIMKNIIITKEKQKTNYTKIPERVLELRYPAKHGGKKIYGVLYMTMTEYTGTGRGKCKLCGEIIKEGIEAIKFIYQDGTWFKDEKYHKWCMISFIKRL